MSKPPVRRAPPVAVLAAGSLLAACGVDASGPSELPVEATVVSLEVTPAADLAKNGGTVHLGFVAYQDGDAPWQLMERDGDRYVARVTSERFGVAVGCTPHTLAGTALTAAFVSIQQATVWEGTELTDYSCVELLRPGRIMGTATGLPTPRSTFRLGMGEGSTNANVRADGFSVAAYATPTDVVAYFDGGTPSASKVMRLLGVDPMQGAPLSLDFTTASPLETRPVSVTASTTVLISSQLRTAKGGRFLPLWSPPGQTSFLTVPRAMMQPGDLIQVGITATEPGQTRESFTYLAEPGAAALELGTKLGAAAPTLAGGPAARAAFTVEAGARALPLVDFQLSTSGRLDNSLSWHSAKVSRGWFDAAATNRYEMPDMSALPGFSAAMSLPAGAPVRWQAVRTESSSKSPIAGQRIYVATSSGELAR